MGLQQYLAVHQLVRLIAALHVTGAEMHVEELNRSAHPSRTRRGDERQDVLSQTELLQTHLILKAYRNHSERAWGQMDLLEYAPEALLPRTTNPCTDWVRSERCRSRGCIH